MTSRLAALAALLLLGTAAPARADLTGFLGVNTTPANRQVRGGAIGINILIIGFEGEFAYTPDDVTAAAPSLTTGMGNVLLQTPTAVMGLQPYVTTGGGIYKEELGTHSDTAFGVNAGVGVKVSLVGPLRLRIDYRVFKLGSGALYTPVHRVYAGINLKLYITLCRDPTAASD